MAKGDFTELVNDYGPGVSDLKIKIIAELDINPDGLSEGSYLRLSTLAEGVARQLASDKRLMGCVLRPAA